MRKLTLVLGCLLVLSLPLHAKTAFSGSYTIKGSNPGVGPYTGTLTITARGDVYDLVWVIGSARYAGVGIASGDTLSVAYAGVNPSFMGVVSYTPRANGLEGKWAIYGGPTKAGTETATRK